MLSEPASANSAGSLFHSGIVWLVKENLQSSVLALFSLNLCRWVRRVRPSAFSMPRSSGVTATSPCTTLLTCAPRRSNVIQFFWSARKCLFPPFLWVKLWAGWVGRGYTEISRYFPASWINWVTLVTKIKLLYSLRF